MSPLLQAMNHHLYPIWQLLCPAMNQHMRNKRTIKVKLKSHKCDVRSYCSLVLNKIVNKRGQRGKIFESNRSVRGIRVEKEEENGPPAQELAAEFNELNIRDQRPGGDQRRVVSRDSRTRIGTDSVNFPKAPWPYFDGDPLLWPAFWQQFKANAGDKNISDVQKCSYLIMSLKGRAERAVKGYLATEENYPLIVATLKRQFGDLKVIKESLQNEMLNLPVANETVGSLRSCFEELERICRQLQTVGLNEGADGEFMLMAVKNKFPRNIVLEILKKEKESGQKWQIAKWRQYLNEVITLREEALRCTRSLHFSAPSFYQRRNDEMQRGFNRFKGQGQRFRNFNRENDVRRVFSVQEMGRRNSGKMGSALKCILCGKSHWAANCRQVVGREARLKIIDAQGRCHKCLRKGHDVSRCTGKGCIMCQQEHHKAICPRAQSQYRTGANAVELGRRNQRQMWYPESELRNTNVLSVMANTRKKEVILMTKRAKIFGGSNSAKCLNVLLFFDGGSQLTLVTDELIKRLRPPRVGASYLEFLPIRQQSPTRLNSAKYLINIELEGGGLEEIIVSRIDNITNYLKRVNLNSGKMEVCGEKPDILIGMAEFWKFFRKVLPISNGLFRVDTTVGPIVCGQLEHYSSNYQSGVVTTVLEQENVTEPTQFWNLETIGVWDNPEEKDDEVALKMFNESIQKKEGRYVVSWPWKVSRNELPTNFAIAYRRLISLLGKLKISPDQLNGLDKIFKENLKEDIVEESEIKGYYEHFLPHHCVFAPGKKPRVVFDGSAKVRGGKCLNDMLFRGPIEMPQLPGLLIRSRVPKIALWGDIQRAFWTLGLKEQEREFVKFLWVKDVHKGVSQDNLLVLRFKRVPFGVISSPFLLGVTIRHHLKGYNSKLAREIERNLFVNNVFVGCANEEEALEKYEKMKEIFAEAGMNLREFIANSKGVNERIPTMDRLDKEKPKSLWDAERKWDDNLSDVEKEKWVRITQEWSGVSFYLKRKLNMKKGINHLHVFVDASKEAYATCVYFRSGSEEGIVTLLYSRSRLKPKRMKVSIPRMELLGVLIGSRAIKFVEKEMSEKIDKMFLWCDSKPVLAWINSGGEQPRFVANRLTEIRTHTQFEFGYVPTEENPADVASRGCTPQQLEKHPLWWKGPKWLAESQDKWPKELNFKISKCKGAEEQEVLGLVNTGERSENVLIKFENYKKWNKVVVTVTRIIKVCKKWLKKVNKAPSSPIFKEISDSTHITPEDYKMCENTCLKFGQVGWETYVEKNQQIQWEKDQDELIRLKTRISRADVPESFYRPIAFPKGSPILEILVQKAHEDVMHERVDATLNEFLSKFWAPGCRNVVKKVLKTCVICKKNSGPSFALPRMPAHPEKRVRRACPFEHVSLDYLGPSVARTEKGGEKRKYWVVLITCLTTRGVYLEPVFDLTAEAFLHVLRRFANRRGKPTSIISDNAQTFKLAAKTVGMCEYKKENKNGKLDEYLVKNKIGWRFIPALSPWENGCAERLVKMCKDAFKSALGRVILTKDELSTFTSEVEAFLNSRPLTYVSTEPGAGRALRPIDFINPGAELCISLSGNEESDDEYKLEQKSPEDKLKERWRRTNKALDMFWERWNREYLLMLRNRNQWYHKGSRSQEFRAPEIGEVVMIEDEFHPRNTWAMARIVEINGVPGVVRSVKLKTNSGKIVERPVNKIYPLETNPKGLTDTNEQQQNKKEEKIKGRVNADKQKINEQKKGHLMVTRAKAKLLKSVMGMITFLLFFGLALAIGQNTTEKVKRCGECEIKCDAWGIVLDTPKWIQKMEICCMGSCFSRPFRRTLHYYLPREQMLIGHECTITYWSKRERMYKNRIYCPPTKKCASIKWLSWDLILNPECWTKLTETFIGFTILILLFMLATIISCFKSIFIIVKYF